MTFSLEMPKQYFDTSKYVAFYGTYAMDDVADSDVTVTCEIKLGDVQSATVKEFNKDFAFDKATATKRLTTENAANLSEDNGYKRNYDPKLYNLMDSIGGKMRQNCAAITEISPEDAQALNGKSFTIKKFGAYYYDDDADATTSTTGVETKKTYPYKMPAPEGGKSFKDMMKPVETGVKDRQLLASQEQTVSAATIKAGITGEVKQSIQTGFDFNPMDEAVNDELVFNFDLDAPAALMPKGSRVVQYVTFSNPANKKEKPQTIGCTTQVGDPYVSSVMTWKGSTSMADTSKAVKGKAFDKQNNKEKAKKKESFKLTQDHAWYTTEEKKAADGVTDQYLQPCIAKLDMGKKMEATDPFFATYKVDMGVRIYANDTTKEFISLPQKTSTVEIKKPNTDLKSLYEEV